MVSSPSVHFPSSKVGLSWPGGECWDCGRRVEEGSRWKCACLGLSLSLCSACALSGHRFHNLAQPTPPPPPSAPPSAPPTSANKARSLAKIRSQMAVKLAQFRSEVGLLGRFSLSLELMKEFEAAQLGSATLRMGGSSGLVKPLADYARRLLGEIDRATAGLASLQPSAGVFPTEKDLLGRVYSLRAIKDALAHVTCPAGTIRLKAFTSCCRGKVWLQLWTATSWPSRGSWDG